MPDADRIFPVTRLTADGQVGRVFRVNRRLPFLTVVVTIAAGLGFAAGYAAIPVSMPATSPAAATPAANPPLPATVALSNQELTNVQLHLAAAEMKPLIRTVSAVGTVGYDQLHLARITPPARGRVETLEVTVGERVTAGQPLAILDNFELSAAHSRVTSAAAAVNQAKAQLAAAAAAAARAANLIGTGGMAQSELDARRATAAAMEAALRTREAELRQYREEEARLIPVNSAGPSSAADEGSPNSRSAVVAPFPGVVDSASVAPGEIVDPSTQIFTVADLSTVWVQADVAESDLEAVRLGDAVQIQVSAYPGRVFAGRVTYISDQIDPMTGSAKVRCAIPNPDGALRVNMFATASILSPQNVDAVMVPTGALQEVDGRSVVFVPTGPGQFAWRAVRTGLAADGYTQIVAGLEAGTPVVAEGSYWLKAALMQSAIPDEG